MSKYIYIGSEEFRGSIKGVARFIRKGDLINPEDVGYFTHRYPDRIVDIEPSRPENSIDQKEIFQVLANQSDQINQLINLVKNQPVNQTVVLSSDQVERKEIARSIEIQEDSMANLMRVETSNIESRGSAGETKTEGLSVAEKIKLLRKVIKK